MTHQSSLPPFPCVEPSHGPYFNDFEKHFYPNLRDEAERSRLMSSTDGLGMRRPTTTTVGIFDRFSRDFPHLVDKSGTMSIAEMDRLLREHAR